MDPAVAGRAGWRVVLGGLGVLAAALVLVAGLGSPTDSVPFALLIAIPAVVLLFQARGLLD